MTEKTAALIDSVPKTYDDAVLILAAAHAADLQVDIYSLPDAEKKVVRLIEVSDSFVEGGVDRRTPTGGWERVVPVFPIGSTADFPFRSEIVQVTPAEWEQVRRGELKLNRDWGDLRSAEKVGHGE